MIDNVPSLWFNFNKGGNMMKTKENNHITLMKNTEKSRNRIIIPKFFVDKHGSNFYMEVYDDYIKLIPINKKKE